MSNNTRRIVVLDKLNSSRIEQAIFILRDTEEEICESDAVQEAQRIVNNYMSVMSGERMRTNGKKSKGKFIFGMSLYTLMTVMLTTFIMSITR